MAVQKNDSPEQGEFEFPDTNDFPSYDEIDSSVGQAELPEDSYDADGADHSENTDGGCCVR